MIVIIIIISCYYLYLFTYLFMYSNENVLGGRTTEIWLQCGAAGEINVEKRSHEGAA